MFLIINPIIELLALIASIIFLWKDRTWWRYFIAFLALVVSVETIATYLIVVKNASSNNWLFNGYLPFQYIFYFFLFKNLLSFQKTIAKCGIWIGISLLFLLYGFDLYTDGFNHLAYRSLALSNICCFALSCIYFLLLLKREDYFNLGTYPPFWLIAVFFSIPLAQP